MSESTINKIFDPQSPVYIVAELSCNHNQDINQAIQLIHKAKKAGADAVKLQTYTPDTMTIDCDNENFRLKSGTIWDGMTLYQLYQKAYTPWEWFPVLQKEAHNLGLDIFSSPFDKTAVDFLEQYNVPVYKIASFEVNDHTLLRHIANTRKPVILSTGACNLTEVSEAIKILRENGTPHNRICVLKCTSAYPAPIEDTNLKTIPNIRETFCVTVGLSDHTTGIEVPIASVALGAKFIEKHFTLDKNSGSPDDKFSLEPEEFRQMVDSVRKVEQSLGSVKYDKSENEKKSFVLKRSLYVVKDIKKGERFTSDNIRSIRPGNGLHTRYWDAIIENNSIARCDIKRGTPLSWTLVDQSRN